MEPVRLATIGTSAITERLLDAASGLPQVCYVGTLSRNAGHAREFTLAHGGATPFSSLAELCASPDAEAVYVASPNAAHLEQALVCVRAGKHVLVEKPLCPRADDARLLFDEAERAGVVALEAMRPLHDPVWGTILATLPRLGRLRRATLRFGKYSSRYDELLAGRHTNIFDARMATGALMDLGIYCVEPMVAAFGAPDVVVGAAALADEAARELTGGAIDVAGSALCTYGDEAAHPGLVVELAYSKVTQDLLPCQMEGERGTLVIDAVSTPGHVRLHTRGHAVRAIEAAAGSVGDTDEELPVAPCENTMVHELADFALLVRGRQVRTVWGTELSAPEACAAFRDVTLASLRVTDDLRRQAGIVFPTEAGA